MINKKHLICLFILLITFNGWINASAISSLKRTLGERQWIFIDVGGNNGDSLRWFYNTLYSPPLSDFPEPGQPEATKFDRVIVWEPNSDFFDDYERLKKQYTFELIPAAATTHDGILSFSGTGLGGSVVSDSGSKTKKGVPSIDFSKWLRENVRPHDYAICKIDAEGSEYDIVQKMMIDGTLCLCDRLSIEWHGWLDLQVHFNDPSQLRLESNMAYACPDCTCNIPHLKLTLPYIYCSLPQLVANLRRNWCAHPLEKWL